MRRLEACQSPVWDTVLTMIALADAGLPADHPALASAARWVLGEEIRGPGDWQVRRPDLAAGGWAFEFDNDVYPDTDDTAEVVLHCAGLAPDAREPRCPRTQMPGNPEAPGSLAKQAAIDRGLAWLAGMQSKDGGWGAFDADNTRQLVNKLPFCDFGAVIDPPSADVTAHIVEAFAAEGRATDPAVRRGVVWLLRAQEPDGSWFGRWGANYVYGTGAVVPALIAAGVKPSKPAIRRAVAWLEEHQNPDGGWGEDLRSYDDPALGRAVPPPRRRPPGRCSPCSRQANGTAPRPSAASAGSPGRSGPTAAGTSPSTPAPGSPATSTSTITCTGWPSL